MKLNTVKQRMQAGELVIGGVCFSGSPLMAERLAMAGCDFVIVDIQHGIWDKEAVTTAFRGIRLGNATPMARVEQNDFYAIGSVLDQGALGVVVPMVNTRQEAESAVFAARYPPQGGRSLGAMGAAVYGMGDADAINEELFLAVQIETAEAVENAEEILSVEGVDGCWVGPADLARSLGVNPQTEQGRARHEEHIQQVLAACHKTGKIPGIAPFGHAVKRSIEWGFLFVTAVYDLVAIQEHVENVLQELRART